jgi:hypothetical protein
MFTLNAAGRRYVAPGTDAAPLVLASDLDRTTSGARARSLARTFTGLNVAVRKVRLDRDAAPDFSSDLWRLVVILEAVGGRFSLIEPGQRRRAQADPQNALFLIPPHVKVGVQADGVRLVSRRIDYDGLVYAEDGKLLRWDEQLDAASDTGLLVDQAQLVECLEHLVD